MQLQFSGPQLVRVARQSLGNYFHQLAIAYTLYIYYRSTLLPKISFPGARSPRANESTHGRPTPAITPIDKIVLS